MPDDLPKPVPPVRDQSLRREKKLSEVEPPGGAVWKRRDGGRVSETVYGEIDRAIGVRARVLLSFFPKEPKVPLDSLDLLLPVRPEMAKQLVVRRPEVGRSQHARLGQGIVGVEKPAEHGENVPYLRNGVEIASYAGLEPHSRPREGLFVDGNVARPSKQQGRLPAGLPLDFTYFRGHRRGFPLHRVGGVLSQAGYYLHRGVPTVFLPRRMLHVPVGFRGESALEKGVEKSYQGRAGPVVPGEGYPLEIVPAQHGGEYLGLGSAKAVDRLVHVPDQHQASAPGAFREKVHEP